ncbi:Protein of unknown function [Cohaesibacter sp. ES.047]|uniref:DUF2849 domain-containing protein n=1 Tax=Cohaesibacter sp. ES.047 TaxID=1798205 RepID=UPI000BB9AAFF|nr:DUF2849 domain-containing protein [Cohaesibacter sp. ES.047]SNY93685.1 Protein of unknown function [Cohaesibacter sp. ES.047]
MFVATGNRLLDGIVVYLAKDASWVEDIQSARIYEVKDDAQAAIDAQDADIVSLDVIPVEHDVTDGVRPARLRERIRAAGPTINPFETIDLSRRFPHLDH